MRTLTWTHDAGESAECGECVNDAYSNGMDDMPVCTTPTVDRETTDMMADQPDGSAYCYCGHVLTLSLR